MRSVFLDSNNNEPLLSQARARMREEEFISSVRAFLSRPAVAEPDYLDYVQSKLLPHTLSFDRRSNISIPAWDTSQAAQFEPPSHPVIIGVQPSATFLPTSSLQPLTNEDRDLFAKFTAFEDHHASHDMASVDTEMLGGRDKDDAEALTERCNTCSNATLPVFISSSKRPKVLPTTGDSTMVFRDIMNDVAETRDTEVPYEGLFQADSAVDLPLCTTHFNRRSVQSTDESAATESRARETSNHHTSREHALVDDRPFCATSSSAREDDLDVPPSVTEFPSSTYEDKTLDVPLANNRPASGPVCGSSLPSYIRSAATSPSLLSSNPSPLAEHESIWPEGSPQTPYARCHKRLEVLYPSLWKHTASIIKLGDSLLQEDIVTFLKSFCSRWSQTDLWNLPALSCADGDDPRMRKRREAKAEAV